MRNRTMTFVAAAGALIIFNVLFFIWTPDDRPTVSWISYIFMTLSFVILTLKYIYPRKGQRETYSLVVPEIALAYMIISIIAGVLLMILPANVTIAITIQLLLLIYYGTRIAIHIQANRRTARNEEERKDKVADLKSVAAQIKIS